MTRTGRPPVTSRAAILGAARRLVEREGWERLTVRALAAELGVGTTTLYHHVRDKEHLLFLLVDDHAARIPRPTLPDDPRGRIIAVATVLHDGLAGWPWTADVLTVDGYVGRLSERALWTVETIVAAAVDHGCTPPQAVEVFRSLWYYTVGEILVRAHSAGARRPPAEEFLQQVDPERLPHLAEIGDRWPELAARDTYRAGLAAFVDGLLSTTSPRSPG